MLKYINLPILVLLTITFSSCSNLSTESTTKKGYFLSLQMAVQALELSKVTHKDFTMRCHPREDYKIVNCKFSKIKNNRKKQALSSKSLLQQSFQNGLKELDAYSGDVSLTFEGI